MCSSSPVRTPSLHLTAERPSTGKCWIPPKKDTSHPRAKEKPQQDGRRGKIAFRIKPYTHQRCLESSNKTLCTPGPRDPTETEPDLPLSAWVSPAESRVSSGLSRGQGLWLQQTWEAPCATKSLMEEVAISSTIKPPSRRPTNWRTIL